MPRQPAEVQEVDVQRFIDPNTNWHWLCNEATHMWFWIIWNDTPVEEVAVPEDAAGPNASSSAR